MPAPEEQGAAFQKMLHDMKPLFWDTDISRLDMDENHRYIIARLLNMGGMRGYFWIRDHYSAPAVVDTLAHRRDINPIVQNFVASQYDIPKEAIAKYVPWR